MRENAKKKKEQPTRAVLQVYQHPPLASGKIPETRPLKPRPGEPPFFQPKPTTTPPQFAVPRACMQKSHPRARGITRNGGMSIARCPCTHMCIYIVYIIEGQVESCPTKPCNQTRNSADAARAPGNWKIHSPDAPPSNNNYFGAFFAITVIDPRSFIYF